MDPAFDNCNIGEFDNSEKVLIGNANSQLDVKFDQNAEFYDEQDQPVKQTTKELLKQFNDGLNNFIQDKTNQTENILNNDFNNAFSNIETELIDRQNDFENEFLKNNDNDLNLQISQQISQNENFDDNVASGIDITDDIAMQTTETSEATTNLLDDHSTLSNSKDTLSENPFDNRLPETNVDDAKSTPMISPNSEEVPHHDELINDDEQNEDYLKLNGNGQFSDFDEKSLSERNEHFHENLGSNIHENLQQVFNENAHQVFQETLKDAHENPQEFFSENSQEVFNGNAVDNFHENITKSNESLSSQQDLQQHLQDLHEHAQNFHEQSFMENKHEEENLNLNMPVDTLNESGLLIEQTTVTGSDMEKGNQIIDDSVINLPELGEVDELQNYQQHYLEESFKPIEQNIFDEVNENQISELENNTETQEFPPQYETLHELSQQHNEINKDNVFEAPDSDHDDYENNPFCQEINETQIHKQIINDVQEFPQHNNEFEESPLQEQVNLKLEMQSQELPEKKEFFENIINDEQQVHDEFNLNIAAVDNIGEQKSQENVYQEIDNKELECKANANEIEDISGHNQEIENIMKKSSNDDNFDQNLDQHQQSLNADPLQPTPEQIQSCDASEDEFNYIRLKEGDSEKHELEINETEKHNTESVEKSSKTEEVFNKHLDIKSQESSNNIIPQDKNNQQQKLVLDLNLQQDLDDDMNHQLNPEAKEFIPSTSPLENNGDLPKFSFYNRMADEVVAQSPNKNAVVNMDEILLPNEEQFDIEAEHRPHEFDVQHLNLKEATHAPEKELVSPINEAYFRGIDLHKKLSPQVMVGFHPIAEFENANMRDSIYIENPTAHEAFEMDRVEQLLNSVQPIPQDILFGASGDYINEDNTALNGSYDLTKDVLMEQDLEDQLEMFKEENGVTTFIQEIIQVKDTPQKINLNSFHQNGLLFDGAISQEKSDIGFSVQGSSSETTTAISSDVAVDIVNETRSSRVAEKNIKNKLDSATKSGKVPEARKPLLNRAAAPSRKAATEKPASLASKVKATTEKVNKPKTITVASAPAPKTLSFFKPRTLTKATPTASAASTVEKKTIGPSERKVIERKSIAATTNKLKSDVKSPPTLVIKKPTTSKTEIKPDSKSTTGSIRSASSKTTLTSKSTISAKAPVPSVARTRPASAIAAVTISKTSLKPATTTTTTTLRNTVQAKTTTAPKPASPRGTTVKSPTKPLSSTTSTTTKTTTTTTRTNTATSANKLRPSSATTLSSITKTQPTRTSAGTVRKTTTTTTTKQSNTLTPPKKPSPIKRPQTATPKLITDKSTDIKVTDPSNITETTTTTTTIIQQEVPIKEIENLIISDELNLQNDEPKLNGSHITTDEVTAV